MTVPQSLKERVLAHQEKQADRLEEIRQLAAQIKQKEMEREDLAERVAILTRDINKALGEDIPLLMAEVGVDRVGVAAEGNSPAFDCTLKDYCRASIAASWPEEKRKQALDWLDNNQAGDLIKTEIFVFVPREKRELAKQAVTALHDLKLHPEVKENVHSATLSAWLREEVDKGHIPPLDLLGGSVGKVAVLKPRKDR